MWSDPFYDPSHFTFALELSLLRSKDPAQRSSGLALMQEKIAQGNTEAILALANHFYRGPAPDLDAACHWYLEAARRGRWEGLEKLTRFFLHPEDDETRLCVQRLKDAGISEDYILRDLKTICMEAAEHEPH